MSGARSTRAKTSGGISARYSPASVTFWSDALHRAISGVVLLTYMIVHLFQFRFGDTQPYKLRPPPLMINFDGINPFSDSFLHLFFVTDPSVPEVEVRDIYKLEYDLFQSWGWVWYYMLSVLVFATHFWLGWEKVVPASQLGIPKALQFYVTCMGR